MFRVPLLLLVLSLSITAYGQSQANTGNVTEARIQTGGGFLQLGRNKGSRRSICA